MYDIFPRCECATLEEREEDAVRAIAELLSSTHPGVGIAAKIAENRPHDIRRLRGDREKGRGWMDGDRRENGDTLSLPIDSETLEARVLRLERELHDLQTALIAHVAHDGAGTLQSPPALTHTSVTVEELIPEYLRSLSHMSQVGQVDRRRESAIWKQILGRKHIGEITGADIVDLYHHVNNGERAPATIASFGTNLRHFFGYAIECHQRLDNPVTPRVWPKIHHGAAKRVAQELTFADEELLCKRLEEIAREGYVYKDGAIHRFPRASVMARFVRFVVRCPLRLRAIKSLRWYMLNAENILCVPRELVKTNIYWAFALTPLCVEYLGPRGNPDDLIFPGLGTTSTIFRWLQHFGREIGLDHLNATNLRRTFVARLRRVASTLVIDKMSHWRGATISNHYNLDVPQAEALDYQERAERAAREIRS